VLFSVLTCLIVQVCEFIAGNYSSLKKAETRSLKPLEYVAAK